MEGLNIYFPLFIASNNNLELCSFGLIDQLILNKIGCAKLVGWGALIEFDNFAQVI
uniref:Uncharacterized protein n=1 Tax=Meloidogyne incognita TaxID=6306 RepID=A0A914KWZ1_MELIC